MFTAHDFALRSLEALGKGYLVLDAELRVVFATDTACATLGVAREVLVGNPFTTLGSDVQAAETAIRAALESQVRGSTSFAVGRDARWVGLELHPAPDGVSVVLSERSFRTLPATTTALLDVLPIGLMMLTEESPTVLHVNPAFERITGFALRDVLGHALDEAAFPNLLRTAVAQSVEAGKYPEQRANFPVWKRQDGGEMMVRVRTIPHTFGEERVRCLLFEDTRSEEQMSRHLSHQMALQDILFNLAKTYIHLAPEGLEATLQGSVEELGQFVGADRFYIITYDWEQMTSTNTHEWCAEGIEPQMEFIQNLSVAGMEDWTEPHRRGETLLVDDVDALEPNSRLYQILAPQGIKSMIGVPIMENGECYGFVGIDAVRAPKKFSPSEQKLLHLFSELLVHVRARIRDLESVREREAMFRQITENMTDVIWTTDLAFNVQYVSSSVSRVFGFTQEESKHQTLEERYAPESIQTLYGLMGQAIEKMHAGGFKPGDDFSHDIEVYHKDGTTRQCLHTVSPKFDDEGCHIGFVGTTRDISAQRKAERDLQASREALRERLKELSCLYAISQLGEDRGLSQVEYLQRVANSLPAGFLKPQRTSVKIEFNAATYLSEGFTNGIRCMRVPLVVEGQEEGYLTVCNPEDLYFLAEEEDLVQSIKRVLELRLEQDRAEERRKASEDQYRILADHTFHWEFWMGADGQQRYHSPSSEKVTGYTVEELVALPGGYRSLVLPEDLPRFDAHHHEREQRNRPEECTFRIRNRAGEVRHIHHVCLPVYAQDGGFLGLRGTNLDVTEREQQRLALEEQRRFLEDLIENSGSLIHVKDAEGRYVSVNQKWRETTGFSAEEVYGKKPTDLKPNARGRAAELEDLQVLETGVPIQIEEELTGPEGHRYFVSTKFAVRDGEGRIKGVCGMATDVTELKLTEMSLRESETRLRSLVESQTNYVLRTDMEGRHTYWNDKFDRDFGWIYESLGLEGADSLKSICPWHHQRTYDTVQVCAQYPGRIEKVELDKPAQNGGIRTTLWEFVCLTDERGTPTEIQCMGIDISDRREVERQLEERERNYRSLFMDSPMAYLILKDGTFIDCNLVAAELIGGTTHDLIGKSPADVSPQWQPNGQSSAALAIEILSEATRAGWYEFEWMHQRLNGTTFLTHVSLTVSLYNEEQVLFVTWQDITERREAEELLRKLSRAVEQSPVSIVITDLKGQIEYANETAQRTTGYTLEELKGKTPRVLKSGETSLEEYKRLWSNITAGREWRGVFHNRRKNGELYWEASTITPILDASGKPTHFLGIKEDITERRKMEEALAQSEQRFRDIAEHSRTIIWEVDLSGNYTYVSPVVEAVLGYTPEELIGKKYIYELRPQHEQEHFLRLYGTSRDACSSLSNHEGALQRKDGSTLFVTTSWTPVWDAKGRCIGFRGAENDITERKLAEDEMRKFRIISDQANYGTAMAGPDGKLIYVNEAFARMHGYSREEALQLSVPDTHPPSAFPRMNELMGKLFNEGGFVAEEIDRIHRDGSVFPSLMSTQMIHDENGAPQFLSATVLDISSLKFVEQENRKLTLAIEQSPVAIVITDLEAHILYASPAFYTITGFSPEDVLGQNCRMLKSGKTPKSVYEAMWTSLKQGQTWQGEWLNRRKDASEYWESVSITPITNELGEVTSYLAVKQDITERRRAEQEIRDLNATLEDRIVHRTMELARINEELRVEIEERTRVEEALKTTTRELESFFNVSLDLLCIADFEGRFVKVNKAWEDLLGYSRAELELSLFMDFVHPDDIQPTLDAMSHLGEGQTVLSFINRYRANSGEYRVIEWHSVPVGDHIYAAARDITERTRNEEQLLKARNEAEHANQAKSEFLSRMSHELRTPMNSILGFAQLLEMGTLTAAQQKSVAHILRSGKHLLGLINEVLDIARIEAGRVSMSIEPVDASEVIREMMDTVTPLAVSRSITLQFVPSLDVGLHVQADRQRIKQVLLNLMNNAIKYNKAGGHVWVKAESQPSTEGQPVKVRFSVIDSGVGIAESDIPRLFVPFERIGAEQTDTEGTGLGLAVVKKLVDLMGGTIGVESEPGKGSTFWVELPRMASQMEVARSNGGLEEHRHSPRELAGTVLYVEDNSSNIELIEQILANARPSVNLVTTMFGQQALDMAIDVKPNLVLLDLNLPDIHGSKVFEILQADPRTQQLPVVVISADAMPKQLEALLKAGVKRYLTKPLDIPIFLEVIDEYLL